jgi:uridine kinase
MAEHPIEFDSIDEAVVRLSDILSGVLADNRQVVGIGGAVGSGKSTLASRLDAAVISTDNYLPDYAMTPDHLRDEPESSNLNGLANDLLKIKEHGVAEIPTWCFQKHRSIGTQSIIAERGIVCEGLFALHPALAHSIDIRVMVMADKTVRWKRWKAIEESGQRGWGVERAKQHFDEIAEPTFSKYVQLYHEDIDFIVHNSV